MTHKPLADLTANDLYASGLVGKNERLKLSDMRDLPDDDLLSPEMVQWVRHWWEDAVSALYTAGAS